MGTYVTVSKQNFRHMVLAGEVHFGQLKDMKT